MNMEKIDALIDAMVDEAKEDMETRLGRGRYEGIKPLASLIQARTAARNAKITTKKER